MSEAREGLLQKALNGVLEPFSSFLPFVYRIVQLKAVATAIPVVISSSSSMPDFEDSQAVAEQSGTPSTIPDNNSYEVAHVDFSQLRRELATTNPRLATLASTARHREYTSPSYLSMGKTRFLPLQQRSNNGQAGTSDHFKGRQSHAERITDTEQYTIVHCNGPLQLIPTVDFGAIKNDIYSSFATFAMTPTKPTHAPEEFHFFQKLPLELQIEIWNLALEDIDPRVVSLRLDKADIPGVIQACQVSRNESRKKFRFCVTRSKGGSGLAQRLYSKKLYRFIDPRKDVLHLANEPIPGMLEVLPSHSHPKLEMNLQCRAQSFNDCLPNITHLALDLKMVAAAVTVERIGAQTSLWNHILPLFPALKLLYVVVTQSRREVTEGVAVGHSLSKQKGLWLDRIWSSEILNWPQDSDTGKMLNRVVAYFYATKLKGVGIPVEYVKMRELERTTPQFNLRLTMTDD